MLAATLLMASFAFAAESQGAHPSQIEKQTKNRYYKPTPPPKLKLEWPAFLRPLFERPTFEQPQFERPSFDLGEVGTTGMEEKKKTETSDLGAPPARNEAFNPGKATGEEAIAQARNISAKMEAKKKSLDEEIALLQKG